jgi:hypothetical protein
MNYAQPTERRPLDADTVLRRVQRLQELNAPHRATTERIRKIMNGGRAGLEALFGRNLDDLDESDRQTLPYANLILRGAEKVAHRLGRAPDLVVDPPAKSDNEKPYQDAERRARIVEAYDDRDELEMRLPQVGRWLPGYGYVAMTIDDCYSPDGHWYPKATLHDPYSTYPGTWGDSQHPSEVGFVTVHDPQDLANQYPEHAATIMRGRDYPRGSGGGVILSMVSHHGDGVNQGGWRRQTGGGLEVVKYVDITGTYLVVPERKLMLDHVPNLLSCEPFVIFKRFSFDQLAGQFDHAIGLMASLAKFNLLLQIAMQDAVFAPTDVYGYLPPGGYQVGRGIVNQLDPQTKVERPVANVPYQSFQHVASIEQQFRIAAGYSEQMDGTSPTAWATGQGLEELATGIDLEIREYQTVLRYGLQRLDKVRLEHDVVYYPDESKPMAGVRKGEPFAETYRPRTHIAKALRTRREYGVMAGWDDARKIVTGLQLQQAGLISRQRFMENLDGLTDVTRELDRIQDEETMGLLRQAMGQRAIEGDPAAFMALIDQLPESEQKEVFKKFFTPAEPELSAEEAAMLAPAGPELPAAPPDITTVLSQLSGEGEASGGVRTVGTL